MLQYFVIQETPTELRPNEMVVKKPDFMEEVINTRGRRGVIKAASVRSIRDIFMVITDKYDNTINPYNLKLHDYENMMYDGDDGFSKLVLRIIKESNLPLIDKVVEFQLKNRKPVIDTIYYVSEDMEGTSGFTKLGFTLGDNKALKLLKKKDSVV